MISARPIPPRGRDGRLCRLADRPERNHAVGQHRLIGSEVGDEFRQYLPDQPRLVFIDIGRSGIAAPFQFFPFHIQEIAGV